MWKNMVQPYRPEVTNDNIMRFACWMTMAIHTHSQFVILFHCNNGFANALQCYVILTFPVFLLSSRNREPQSEYCHRSLCSNWCRPLYGAQSRINGELAGLYTLERAVSSVTMQQYNCERFCAFYERVPRAIGHAVLSTNIAHQLPSSKRELSVFSFLFKANITANMIA
jgi:hypothetical protein